MYAKKALITAPETKYSKMWKPLVLPFCKRETGPSPASRAHLETHFLTQVGGNEVVPHSSPGAARAAWGAAEQAEPSHLADEQTEAQGSTGLSQSDGTQGTEARLQHRADCPHCGPALGARLPGAKGSPDETD